MKVIASVEGEAESLEENDNIAIESDKTANAKEPEEGTTEVSEKSIKMHASVKRQEFKDAFYPNAIQCLLELYRLRYIRFGGKTEQEIKAMNVWEDIEKDMHASYFKFSSFEIKEKFKLLRAQYLNIKTPEDIRKLDYFRQLHDIYGDEFIEAISTRRLAVRHGMVIRREPRLYGDEILLRDEMPRAQSRLKSKLTLPLEQQQEDEITNKENEIIDMVERELQALEAGDTAHAQAHLVESAPIQLPDNAPIQLPDPAPVQLPGPAQIQLPGPAPVQLVGPAPVQSAGPTLIQLPAPATMQLSSPVQLLSPASVQAKLRMASPTLKLTLVPGAAQPSKPPKPSITLIPVSSSDPTLLKRKILIEPPTEAAVEKRSSIQMPAEQTADKATNIETPSTIRLDANTNTPMSSFSLADYNAAQERRHCEKMDLLRQSMKLQEQSMEMQNKIMEQLIKRL